MIPVQENRNVVSSGVEASASFGISETDTAHIMRILRDTLYSDKILAVLREYSSNAWDAQRMAGRGDRPIKIQLPTYTDSTLTIRDFGPGLSQTDVFEVYNKYGASTKRDSNVAVGMLGIGSKSGFAYSDSFTIISYHGGQMATYVAVIDSSEKGRVDLLDVQPSSEETGVEIQIPVKPSDINDFTVKAQALFTYFKPQPDINVQLPTPPKGKDFPGLGTVLERDPVNYYSSSYGSGNNRGWTAVMGCVPYRINVAQLKGLSGSVHNVSGILYFDIGKLQVAASREELKYGDSTKEALTQAINDIIDKYVEYLLEGIDKLNMWERRLRVRTINDMHLPLPPDLRGFNDSWVQFDKTSEALFKLKSKGYRGKVESTSGIKIEQKSRLVFRNEKRVITGYELKDGDIIVDPVLDELGARKELKNQLLKFHLDGIPQVDISTIKWSKPLTATGRPIDNSRAKAPCLILDAPNINTDRKSERWIASARTPLSTDVYVVLDAYAVSDLSDFYETYQNDRLLIESIGGKMPQVIGYRNTQAKPVERAKLKGKDYKVWRDSDFVDELLKQPGVAQAVAAKVWSNVGSYNIYDAQVKAVGEDTPLGKYIAKVVAGRDAYSKIDRKWNAAVTRVFLSTKVNEAEQEWNELVQLYPLFTTLGRDVSAFGGGYSKQWIEYINMVDLHRKTEELAKQVQDRNQQEEGKAA